MWTFKNLHQYDLINGARRLWLALRVLVDSRRQAKLFFLNWRIIIVQICGGQMQYFYTWVHSIKIKSGWLSYWYLKHLPFFIENIWNPLWKFFVCVMYSTWLLIQFIQLCKPDLLISWSLETLGRSLSLKSMPWPLLFPLQFFCTVILELYSTFGNICKLNCS